MKIYSQNHNLNKLNWMVDKWIYLDIQDDVLIYESWVEAENGYKGYLKTIKNGVTVSEKSLLIKSEGDEIFYLAYVSNNLYLLKLRLTYLDEHLVIFENHDYDQKIIYRLIDFKELSILVESKDEKCNSKNFSYLMSRIK